MDKGKTQTPMNKSDASRIQSTQATSGKDTGSGSFASRAQAAADPFMLPFAQQKLGAYLLKSTIGKVFQDVDWDLVDIQLLQGTIGLYNCALDLELFNGALEHKGVKLLKGTVKYIKVTVPWSNFFQESCSMLLQGVEMVLTTTVPSEPIIQSPILSSSIHFADEFRRSELVEPTTLAAQDSEGLNDLAEIIENILAKVSVVLQDIKITLHNSDESMPELDDTQLEMVLDKLSLCDHIKQKEEIPIDLQNNQDDILSRIVKYVHLSKCEINIIRNKENSTLFEISDAYIRLLFAQRDYLNDSLHSSVYGMANSVILSDFHVAVHCKSIQSVFKVDELMAMIGFLEKQKKPGSEKQNDESEPVMFQLYLQDLNVFIVSPKEPSQLDYENITAYDHLKISLQKVRVENHYVPQPSLHISANFEEVNVSYHKKTLGYTVLYETWANPNVLETSSMYQKINRPVGEKYQIEIEKTVAQSSILPPSLSISIRIPTIRILGYFKLLFDLKDLFPPPQNVHSPKSETLMNLVVSIPLARICFDMDTMDSESIPIVAPLLDIDNLVITYDTVSGFKAPKTLIEAGKIYFGLTSPSNQEFRHVLAMDQLSIQSYDNRERIHEAGLNEEYMKLRHKQSRGNTFMDNHSSKSWSDFGGDSSSSSPNSTQNKRPRYSSSVGTEKPPLSKFFVNWSASALEVELEEKDIAELDWILKTIQRWTFKDPPEPSQPSLSMTGSICELNVRLYSTAKNNLFDYQLVLEQVDAVISINSELSKNLTSVELWAATVGMDTIDFTSSSNWKLLTTCETVPQTSTPSIHVVLTQNDDLELSLRQVTVTVLLNGILLNFPTFKINYPQPPPTIAVPIPKNPLQSCSDVVLVLTHSSVSYTIEDSTALLCQEYLKLESSTIEDSPTQGFDVVTTLTTAYLSVDSSIPLLLQKDHVYILELPMVRVGIFDTIKVQLRLNRQSLPSFEADIYFKQANVETCSNSLMAIIDMINKLPKSSQPMNQVVNEVPSLPEVDTFEMVEETAFFPDFPQEDDDLDWQMNFEGMQIKEEIVVDTIKVYETMDIFVQESDYMAKKEPIKDAFEKEVPEVKCRIHDSNFAWKLYPGNSRSSTPLPYEKEEKKPYVEAHLINIEMCLCLFPMDALTSKSLVFKIKDIEIIDRVPTSHWRRFMGLKVPEEEEAPRETDSNMLSMKWIGVHASQGEEYRFSFKVLPLQFHIDQDTLLFLEGFFRFPPADSGIDAISNVNPDSQPETNPIFFQLCKIDDITIQIDYKPKHVNYQQIQQGQFAELINFLHLDGAKIYLKPIKLTGIYGWSKLFKRIESIWLPHVKETQIQNLASGVQGINSIVNVGSGIADLVLLPIEQFQRDGRIFRGISRGTTSFLKATTLESARIGSKIASGAQQLLEKADRSSSQRINKAEAPKDLKQGLEMGFQSINQGLKSAAQIFQTRQLSPQTVPVAMIQPIKGITSALASTLIGLQNTIDKTQQKRFQEKYKSL